MGAEGDTQRVSVAIEDWLEFGFESAFTESGGAKLDVGFAVVNVSKGGETGQHLFDEHGLQLIRRAWQHAKDLAVDHHPQTGSGAVGVGNHFAFLESIRLLEIIGGHLATKPREPFCNGFLDRRIEHQGQAEYLGDRFACAVIARRSQPSCSDDHIGLCPAFAELSRDDIGVVGDRYIAGEHDATPAELRSDEGEVTIGRQPQQKFVAQGNELKTSLRKGVDHNVRRR